MSSAFKHDELVLKVGTNQMELLEFWLYKEKADSDSYRGTYGINVSKVLEVILMQELTEIPNLPDFVLGMIELRGSTIPIVSLAKWLKIPEPPIEEQKKKIIIAEFNGITIGFVVHQTTKIRRVDWEDINVPPTLINEKYGGSVTGTTKVDDDQILLILDLEKIVAELSPEGEDSLKVSQITPTEENRKKRILVVDDSLVARKQVLQVLKRGNYEVEAAINGKEAWQSILNYCSTAENKGIPLRELLYLVITDVEMPVMDGYTLTRKLKKDERLKHLPVIMHSSLSGNANISKGKKSGCDEYITKFDPEVLFNTVSEY